MALRPWVSPGEPLSRQPSGYSCRVLVSRNWPRILFHRCSGRAGGRWTTGPHSPSGTRGGGGVREEARPGAEARRSVASKNALPRRTACE
jgi:hypothetical protein